MEIIKNYILFVYIWHIHDDLFTLNSLNINKYIPIQFKHTIKQISISQSVEP